VVGLIQKQAKDIGVEPAYIKNLKQHGIIYFTWHHSNAVGAQCGVCHTIVWVDPRNNSVLNEDKPSNVPDSGPGYQAYYQDNIKRFLKSLPPCPKCKQQAYDLFVNNVTYPRFEDGSVLPEDGSKIELLKVDPATVKVWWYEV
jgi:hypothetical protein